MLLTRNTIFKLHHNNRLKEKSDSNTENNLVFVKAEVREGMGEVAKGD